MPNKASTTTPLNPRRQSADKGVTRPSKRSAAKRQAGDILSFCPAKATLTLYPRLLKTRAATKPSAPLLPAPQATNIGCFPYLFAIWHAAEKPAFSTKSFSGIIFAIVSLSAAYICAAVKISTARIPFYFVNLCPLYSNRSDFGSILSHDGKNAEKR